MLPKVAAPTWPRLTMPCAGWSRRSVSRSRGPDRMRLGVRGGIGVGDPRSGVAESGPSGSLATPVETVQRGSGDLQRLAAIVAERQPIEVVLGLPRSLSGAGGCVAR